MTTKASVEKPQIFHDPNPGATRFRLAQISQEMHRVRALKLNAIDQKEEAAKHEDRGTMATMEMLIRRCDNTLLEYHLEWQLLNIDNVPCM